MTIVKLNYWSFITQDHAMWIAILYGGGSSYGGGGSEEDFDMETMVTDSRLGSRWLFSRQLDNNLKQENDLDFTNQEWW